MGKNQELLEKFHEKFNENGRDCRLLRKELVAEEAHEVDEVLAHANHLIEKSLDRSPNGGLPMKLTRLRLAKELADLVYVAYGTAVEYGIDLDCAVLEVHKSNMSKLDANGNPVYREDGKVQKGSNYEEPNMTYCLDENRLPREL